MEQNEVIQSFIKILNWAGNRGPQNYGTDQKLYFAEIHTIDAIGKRPGILQRDLCQIIGVTKGRMSVIIRNLEKKALVARKMEDGNKKEIPLVLTEEGEKAYVTHMQKEKKIVDRIHQLLEQYSPEELKKANYVFEEILKILSE